MREGRKEVYTLHSDRIARGYGQVIKAANIRAE